MKQFMDNWRRYLDEQDNADQADLLNETKRPLNEILPVIAGLTALQGYALKKAYDWFTKEEKCPPDMKPGLAQKHDKLNPLGCGHPQKAATAGTADAGSGAGAGPGKWKTKCRCARLRCKTEFVGEVQKLLGIKSDTKFGGGTRKAVKKFQRKHKLKPDGVICPDGETIQMLRQISATGGGGPPIGDKEAKALEKIRKKHKLPPEATVQRGELRRYRKVALKGIYQVTGRRTEKNEERARDLLQSFWPTISKAIANKDPEVTRNGEPSIVKIHNYARELVQAGWSPSPTTAP